MIENSVRERSQRLVTLTNCPRSVEVSLRYQQEESRLLVHLVNFTGEMTRPMESVVPLHDIRLTLHCAGEARRLYALGLKKNLDIQRIGKDATFEIPVLREYEVLAIEPFEGI